jgi:ribonuclease HI
LCFPAISAYYTLMQKEIEIYTDGGCWGNPGPGGWAYRIHLDGETLEGNGGDAATTNNRMELTAVIEALRLVRKDESLAKRPVVVHTDSQYVKNGISSWIETWSRNGWKTAARKPVKNQDLWVILKELRDSLGIRWLWVKGHAGNPDNERCDALVQEAVASVKNSKPLS